MGSHYGFRSWHKAEISQSSLIDGIAKKRRSHTWQIAAHNTAMLTPYVDALLVDPIAAVVVCDLRNAGIITRDQANRAWRLIAAE